MPRNVTMDGWCIVSSDRCIYGNIYHRENNLISFARYDILHDEASFSSRVMT